jgi:hypothetical protein
VPRAGEHSRDVLGQALGLSAGDIEALEQLGVVA